MFWLRFGSTVPSMVLSKLINNEMKGGARQTRGCLSGKLRHKRTCPPAKQSCNKSGCKRLAHSKAPRKSPDKFKIIWTDKYKRNIHTFIHCIHYIPGIDCMHYIHDIHCVALFGLPDATRKVGTAPFIRPPAAPPLFFANQFQLLNGPNMKE